MKRVNLFEAYRTFLAVLVLTLITIAVGVMLLCFIDDFDLYNAFYWLFVLFAVLLGVLLVNSAVVFVNYYKHMLLKKK